MMNIRTISVDLNNAREFRLLFPDQKKKKELDPFDSNEFDESANLNDIEDYMEQLYEDTASKIKGSGMILQVARNPDNLTELAQNGKYCT